MARLSELVHGVSETLRINEQSVSLCARHLREAKLISKKGRGASAAQMGPRDAVNLLLGLMAAPELKDAAECVKNIRAAKFSFLAEKEDLEGKKLGVSDVLPDFPWLWSKPDKRTRRKQLPLGQVLDNFLGSNFRALDPDTGHEVAMTEFTLTVDQPGTRAGLDRARAQLVFGDLERYRWKIPYSQVKWNIERQRKMEDVRQNLLRYFGAKQIPFAGGMKTTTQITVSELIEIKNILGGF